MLKKYFPDLRQFSLYFFVGTTGTIIDISSLFVFKEYFGVEPVTAVILNQCLVFLYIYILNKNITFQSHKKIEQELPKFILVAVLNYVIAIAWMYFGYNVFLLPYIAVRVSNIASSVVWNFCLYKFWVFRK